MITAVTFGQDTAEINNKLDMIKTGFQGILGIPNQNNVLADFILYQNYPNPFNPETTIRFQIGSPQKVSLVIYDILGRKVRTLINNNMLPGVHAIKWDGRNKEGSSASSGIYFYRLKVVSSGSGSEVFVKTHKMVLIK